MGNELYECELDEEPLENWSIMSIITKPSSRVIPTILCGSLAVWWVTFVLAEDTVVDFSSSVRDRNKVKHMNHCAIIYRGDENVLISRIYC